MHTKWLHKSVYPIVGVLLLVMSGSICRGAGLLIADGGLGGRLEIKRQDVRVTVNNGIAVTEVTQVFHNTEDRQVEALYTFPVPRGASVADFSMWINGKEMVGEVIEKQRAREIYESYKPRRVDPGLLEQVDHKRFEMRIFPIGPQADQKVRLRYYQLLDVDDDWATYVYPLATATRRGAHSGKAGELAFSMQVKSAVPITSMNSPSHGDDFVIAGRSEAFYQGSLETADADLSRDVVVAYHLARPQTGLDCITSRRRGDDGYFCLILTAGEELTARPAGMDYVFILDISGSMGQGAKLSLSRKSIETFVETLGAEDRLEILTFNVAPNALFGKLLAAGADAKANARAYLAGQKARGGTSLRPALAAAYRYADPDRPLNVVILSDGMTDPGERAALLEGIRTRPANATVFCIGVGNEVNRPLLEQLAEDAGGLASFLSRQDDFERQAKAFRRKLTHLAGSDVRIEFGGGQVYDAVPARLPNLYHGTPVRLYGRYRGHGTVTVTVRAVIDGEEVVSTAEVALPETAEENPEIERMWAQQKITQLLKQADRAGSRAAVIDPIVRLGEGYSIASEYTSFLVLENNAEYKRWKIARRNALRLGRDRKAHRRLLDEFDAKRLKADARIGPEAVTTAPTPVAAAPQPAPSRANRGPDLRFRSSGGGGGPVGPFGLLLTAALAIVCRRRRRGGHVR